MLYITPLSIGGVASATLVSQALGAERFDAARLLVRYGIACVYGAALFALRPYLLEAYTPDSQVIAAAMPLLAIVVFYHFFDVLQIATVFVLRAYKVAVVPTVIYAVALWGIGLGGGYLLGFDVGGYAPAWLQGARGFWVANSAWRG